MFKPRSRALALVAGLVGVCGAAATASADGYAGRSVAAPAQFSWTGFYIGANGGYAWSDGQTVVNRETFEVPLAAPVVAFTGNFGSLSPDGGFGGIQAGANLQMGAVVLGFEADGQWADITGDSSATVLATGPLIGALNYTVATNNKVTRFGTLRPRFGLALGRTLVYGTAGLAWGRVEHTMTFKDAAGFNSFDQVAGTQVGYVIGGGIEHAFTSHLSLKVEYQYIDLGSQHHTAVEYDRFGAVSGFRTNVETQTDFHTVRLGLNYKLGGP